ncbi:MAG: outer membrane beta-barrel protein [Rickettsiales bacterium]|jgi:opacity protein-like surface antigen|nr:outer membrane beta-barrel protein [Rickettsiales bacterium]
MKTSLLVMAALLVATSASAAELKQYGSAKIVYSNLNLEVDDQDSDMKTAYGLGLGYGVKISDFRVEGELTLRAKNKLKEDESEGLTNHSLMVNGFYDIATGTEFVPYVGVGFGLNRAKIANAGTHSKFAYGASAGVAYNVNEKTAVDLGYTYTKIADIDDDEAGEFKQDTGEIKLGARYTF